MFKIQNKIGSTTSVTGCFSHLYLGYYGLFRDSYFVLPRPLVVGQSYDFPHHITVVDSLTMDARYVREVKRLIAQRKLGRQIEIAGPEDGNELANRFLQSHIFVMPHSHEGFGMAYLEAMTFAMPVVGSSHGAVKEFVKPGHNGFSIEIDDFESVNTCIHSLHHDRQRLLEMSWAAFETFKKRPQWRDTMESVHGFLSALAESAS